MSHKLLQVRAMRCAVFNSAVKYVQDIDHSCRADAKTKGFAPAGLRLARRHCLHACECAPQGARAGMWCVGHSGAAALVAGVLRLAYQLHILQ